MIKDYLIKGKAVAVDITKCYCDCLYNQREKFIVFKGKEIVEEYDGETLTLGLYFVETDDMNLFHQSNWYSKAIIDLASKEHIPFKITRQIRCVDEDWCWEKVEKDDDGKEISKVSLDNSNLFKNWCDSVIELTEQDEDFTLTKDVINSITGYLGKTSSKTKEVGLSKNLEEVWTDWLVPEVEKVPNLNVYINEIKSVELVNGNSICFEGNYLYHRASKLCKNQKRVILSCQYVTTNQMNDINRMRLKLKDSAYTGKIFA
jgi:hypothetical protein